MKNKIVLAFIELIRENDPNNRKFTIKKIDNIAIKLQKELEKNFISNKKDTKKVKKIKKLLKDSNKPLIMGNSLNPNNNIYKKTE
ncbi:hypothetical protein LRR18_17855, partial [Mangrovimonas sp. AS39]|uniref:hypothetical protein n=1 Tax=Mangrovimonas futianensis TaxID=2895523 RepID=UPI001E34F624